MPDVELTALTPKRFGHHENTFGFLRLLFATLVILSHAPEIHDGNRSHEILTQLFGSLSFGELSVNAFFFISGYLITGSYLGSSTAGSYALKRILRIYPGFLAASLLCCLVVTPLGGGTLQLTARAGMFAVVRALLLQPPDLGTVFPGSYYAVLNGSMWTISYEFRCYILVLLLGIAGLLKRRNFILIFATALLVASMVLIVHHQPGSLDKSFKAAPDMLGLPVIKEALFGVIRINIRLMAIFMAGSCFFLFREKVTFTRLNLLVALIALCGCMLNLHLANAATAVFGGFLILAASKKATGGVLERINNEDDISYGTYLYAWPITKLVFWWEPAWSVVWAVFVVIVSACACGWLSWRFVERPAMAFLRKRRAARVAMPSIVPSD